MILLPIHVLGGICALLFGYTALAATKGATWHRKAGLGFVIAMIVMSLTGALMGALKLNGGNILAGTPKVFEAMIECLEPHIPAGLREV